MEVVKQITLDLLDKKNPALSATSDMPVIETKPDSVPTKEPEKASEIAPETTAPAAPEAAAPAEITEESAPSPDDAAAEPKKAKGVQKRIDELTRQREDERRRAEAAESRLDRFLATFEKGTARELKQTIDVEDPEPQKPVKDPNNPEAYDADLENYVTARSSWIARREVKATLAEQERQNTDREIAENTRRIQDSYRQRVEKAKEKYADFSEVAESPDVHISIPMASAIAHAEDGPEVQYYLGKNPAEAERISRLVPQLQLVELGRISARLATPTPEKPKPVSAAPAPGKPLKGSPETTKPLEELSMEEYAAQRKKQLAEERRPGGMRH